MKRKWTGFTLLEILIALTIFSILALITSKTLQDAFRNKVVMFKQLDQTRQIQFMLTLFTRDTQQMTARSITGNEMRTFPPLIGQPAYIEFTRGGVINPDLKSKQSPFLRVGYACENHRLIRRIYAELDTLNRAKYEDEVILDDLKTCRFAFINSTLQVLPIWRPGAVRPNQQPEPLPRAIQLTVKSDLWGEIIQLFVIPEALYVDLQAVPK